MKATDILFRCSSLGYIMTEPKKKTETLSETCKTHLVDCFISAYYKRREEITSKFLDKGNEREEDSITLLSRLSKTYFKKNGKRLKNDYITGEPDLFIGETIEKATEIIDIKSSWSLHTFMRSKSSPLDSKYMWQGLGYMWLTGAQKHTVAYCLVNGTEQAISDEKRRLAYAMGIIDTSMNDRGYKDKCRQIEINHIFDLAAFQKEYPYYNFDNELSEWCYDIPMNERQFNIVVDRDEDKIIDLQQRVIDCRTWIDLNLLAPLQTKLITNPSN